MASWVWHLLIWLVFHGLFPKSCQSQLGLRFLKVILLFLPWCLRRWPRMKLLTLPLSCLLLLWNSCAGHSVFLRLLPVGPNSHLYVLLRFAGKNNNHLFLPNLSVVSAYCIPGKYLWIMGMMPNYLILLCNLSIIFSSKARFWVMKPCVLCKIILLNVLRSASYRKSYLYWNIVIII